MKYTRIYGIWFVQIPYIISTNRFKGKSMVVLSSMIHVSPNYIFKGAQIRLGLGADAQIGGKNQ